MTEASQGIGNCDEVDSAGTDSDEKKLNLIRERLLADPSDAEALSRAGALLFKLGRYTEAIAHLDKAISSCRCPLCEDNGMSGGAGAPALDADQSRREDIDLHYGTLIQLADCHAAVSDYRQSQRCYRAAVSLAPDRAGAYLGLGALAFQAGQIDQAQRYFNAAGKLQPGCAEAYGGLAMIHQQKDEHAEAFEMYLKCLELDTDNLVALLGLFQTSCRMGNFSKIVHYLEVYLDEHPSDTSVLFCLASLYAKENRLPDARRTVLKVLTLEPDKTEAAELLSELDEALADIDDRQNAMT